MLDFSEGEGRLDPVDILACFKDAMNGGQFTGELEHHILLHIDEAGVIAQREEELSQKRDVILDFWNQVPFLDDENITVQPFFTSREWDLKLVGKGKKKTLMVHYCLQRQRRILILIFLVKRILSSCGQWSVPIVRCPRICLK